MTKREIASLVIKLMGVFILLKTISYVPMVISMMFSGMRSESLLIAGVMVILSIVMIAISLAWSLLIIFFSDKFAARIIKENATIEALSTTINRDDVMMIAISCIGLYFITAAMPVVIRGLLYNAAFMRIRSGSPFVGPSGLLNLLRELIVPAVQIAIGLWLFIGSKGIVKFWKKIRS